MIHDFADIRIRAIASAVPRDRVEVLSFAERFGQEEVERIRRATGIDAFYRTNAATTASDLCVAAACKLFEALQSEGETLNVASDIDALVFVTITPDHLCPPTGPSVHYRLGLPQHVPVFDLSYGCSGYIWGLAQSAMVLRSLGARRVLLLVGETMSKSIDPDDRSTALLFGDGGSATLLERAPQDSNAILSVQLKNNGQANDSIMIPNSAYRVSSEPSKLAMDGTAVVSFVMNEISPMLKSFLKDKDLQAADVKMFAFHQASKMVLEYLRKSLKISDAIVVDSLAGFGNTGSASIPVSISATQAGSRKNLGRTVMAGFGVGLTWGIVMTDLNQVTIVKPEVL